MATPSDQTSLVSKFRGCLIGGLLGDCIGAPSEAETEVSETAVKSFLTNLLSDSLIPDASQILQYTDDTAMAMSVAKSLIEKGEFDPKDMAKKFVDEYYRQPLRGYGANVTDVFAALKSTNYQDVYEPAKRQFGGSGSYGNGAAMRVAPVALYGYDDSNIVKQVAESSALITHAHKNGYNGAILQSLAVHQALKCDSSSDFSPVEFVDGLLTEMETIEKETNCSVGSSEDQKSYCESLKRIKEIFAKKQLNISTEEIAVLLGNSISAPKSVPTAIFAFLRGFFPLEGFESDNPFVRTLYFAIAVGGDTDTIACMAGSIAGAYYGESVIPVNLMKRCEAIEEIKQLGDQLLKLYQKKKS